MNHGPWISADRRPALTAGSPFANCCASTIDFARSTKMPRKTVLSTNGPAMTSLCSLANLRMFSICSSWTFSLASLLMLGELLGRFNSTKKYCNGLFLEDWAWVWAELALAITNSHSRSQRHWRAVLMCESGYTRSSPRRHHWGEQSIAFTRKSDGSRRHTPCTLNGWNTSIHGLIKRADVAPAMVRHPLRQHAADRRFAPSSGRWVCAISASRTLHRIS